MPVPQKENSSLVERTGQMPVPQKENSSLVERAKEPENNRLEACSKIPIIQE